MWARKVMHVPCAEEMLKERQMVRWVEAMTEVV
jgi:hypothetical protein